MRCRGPRQRFLFSLPVLEAVGDFVSSGGRILTILTAIVSVVLVAGGAVYFGACLYAFAGLFRRPGSDNAFQPTVSVIIAARNEENTVGFLLDDLLGQDYPAERFTIHVVDDFSEDRTADIVKSFAARDKRVSLLKAVDSSSPYSHKKRAVHEGILSSGGEIIMTVDADCRVHSGWIRRMVERFVPGVDLVAGEIVVENDGLMGKFEALEFTGIQMMSAGLMNAGFPITCNGANLAYRRSAFERVGGYDGVGRVVSGDDDLLMQKISSGRPSSVVYLTGGETNVRVKPGASLGAFLVQRTRWASKIATYPSRRAVALLAAFFIFFLAVLVGSVGLLLGVFSAWALVPGYGMKLLGDILLCGYGVIKQGRPGLLFLFPLAEVVHVPYILYVTLKGMFGTFEWRGRRTGALW